MKTKIWHCMVSSTHHATCEGEMTGWNVREIWVWDTSCQSSWLPHIIWNTRQFYHRASPLVATIFLVLIVLSWPLASHASSLIRYIIAVRPRRYQVILQHFIENCTVRIMQNLRSQTFLTIVLSSNMQYEMKHHNVLLDTDDWLQLSPESGQDRKMLTITFCMNLLNVLSDYEFLNFTLFVSCY